MDILKRYYNSGGQIISRTPDLATRELYRDVMCRHRFNEMFVAAKESSGPTLSVVPGYMFYDYSGGSGSALVVYDDPGVAYVTGRDGRRALVSNSTDDCSIITQDTSAVVGMTGELSVGLVFRSPSSASYSGWNPFLVFAFEYINSNNDSFQHEETGLAPRCQCEIQFYKSYTYNQYASQNSYIGLSARPYSASWFTSSALCEGASFLSDGGWHVAGFNFQSDGWSSALIDGQEVYSFQMDSEIVRFYRPYVYVTIWGGPDDENKYALDSAWIKSS